MNIVTSNKSQCVETPTFMSDGLEYLKLECLDTVEKINELAIEHLRDTWVSDHTTPPLPTAIYVIKHKSIKVALAVIHRLSGAELIKIRDTNNMTPLHEAIVSNQADITSAIHKKISPQQFQEIMKEKDERGGYTLLHFAVATRSPIFKFLIKNSSPDVLIAQDSEGQTALHLALDGPMDPFNISAALALIEACPPELLNIQDIKGRRPIYLAIENVPEEDQFRNNVAIALIRKLPMSVLCDTVRYKPLLAEHECTESLFELAALNEVIGLALADRMPPGKLNILDSKNYLPVHRALSRHQTKLIQKLISKMNPVDHCIKGSSGTTLKCAIKSDNISATATLLNLYELRHITPDVAFLKDAGDGLLSLAHSRSKITPIFHMLLERGVRPMIDDTETHGVVPSLKRLILNELADVGIEDFPFNHPIMQDIRKFEADKQRAQNSSSSQI